MPTETAPAVEGWYVTDEFLPPDHVVVETKIDDQHGLRNECVLFRQGRLWFFADGSMYVYYTPTHWRYLSTKPPAGFTPAAV